MPTYDYECQDCGHKFELFQSIKADPVKTCPVCNKRKVRRLIGSGSGLIFKGSGFYCTDYRDSGYKSAAKSDSSSSSSTSSSSTSSESKSDSKSSTSSDSGSTSKSKSDRK